MKIRLYLDEDASSNALAEALRSRGIDVLTTTEANMRGRMDEDQLRHATEQGRSIFTYNVKHYTALHKQFIGQGLGHAGIILVTGQYWSVGEQMRRTTNLVQRVPAEEMNDRIEYLSSWG